MSKGKKYKIPHKYLRKYQHGTWHRYKVMGGKIGRKQSLSTLDTKNSGRL